MALHTRFRQGYRLESTIKYSPFYNIHPLTQVIYYFSCLIFTLLYNNPVYLMTILASVIVLGLMYEQPKIIMKSLRFYLIVSVVIILVNVVTNQRGRYILWKIAGNYIKLESLLYGIIMAVSLMSIFLIFISFNKIITQDRFLFVFSKISKRLAFILMMAIRWIPLLNKTAGDISIIQTTKGIDYKSGNKRNLFKKLSVNLEILLAYSMETSLVTAESMKARGYEAKGRKRTFYFSYRFSRFDIIVLTVELMLITANIYCFIKGYGVIDYFKKFRVQNLVDINATAFSTFAVLCIIPFIIELRGAYFCMTSKLRG